jgi:hypothetical protein
MNKRKLNELTFLKITSGGYEEMDYIVPVLTVEEYLEKKEPFYSEFILLPDGRIIEAKPSHAYVLESLVNYLNGEKFNFSPTWYVEERLYYTGAVACWLESQNGFEELTEAQEETLLILKEKGEIKLDYSHYSLEKITYFLSIMSHIREEARAFAEKHAIK